MSAEIIVASVAWLAVAAMVIWDALHKPHCKNKTAKSANDSESRDTPRVSIISRFPGIKHPPDCPEQAKHWYQARRQANFSGAALIVSFFALVGGWLAFHESRIQADAAVADLRPWLKVTIKKTDLTWWPVLPDQDRIGGMSPELTVKNIGKSPAFGARGAVLFYYPEKQTIRETQMKICREIRDATSQPSNGETLFPSDSFDPNNPGIGRLGLGIESKRLAAKDGKFTLMLVGCVDYLFGAPLVHHQTFLAYGAYHIVTAGNPPHKVIDAFVVGEDVKADDILLYKLNGLNDAN